MNPNIVPVQFSDGRALGLRRPSGRAASDVVVARGILPLLFLLLAIQECLEIAPLLGQSAGDQILKWSENDLRCW